MCNNPTFDWHLTNLRNYVTLTPNNRQAVNVNSEKIKGMGQETGILGMPGDYTSPSRFVRAAAFSNTALPSANEEEGIFRAFYTLNAFDIPKGAIRDNPTKDAHTDYTVWTSAVDTRNKMYYYKTYKKPSCKKIRFTRNIKKSER